MSTGHLLTKEERLKWVNLIIDILHTLYKTGDKNVLLFLLSSLYEFCVACCALDDTTPIKLKMLQNYDEQGTWKDFCIQLYTLRGRIVHSPYMLEDDYILQVVSSPDFSRLIKGFLPEHYDEFLDLILEYSKYI